MTTRLEKKYTATIEELEVLCKPLVRWICDHDCPYGQIVISCDGYDVLTATRTNHTILDYID